MGWEAVSHIWCDALYVLVGVVEWGLCASLYTSLCDQVFASGSNVVLQAKSALFLKRRQELWILSCKCVCVR